jgi:hypothetical protein
MGVGEGEHEDRRAPSGRPVNEATRLYDLEADETFLARHRLVEDSSLGMMEEPQRARKPARRRTHGKPH